MDKGNKIFYGYLVIVFILSMYINRLNVYFVGFAILSLLTIGCFVGIYFLVKNFKSFSITKKVLSVLGILLLFSLICLFGFLSSFSGFSSINCYDLKANNIFTGTEKVYCNFPPWYTTITEIEFLNNDERYFILEGNISTVCKNYDFDALQRYCKKNLDY